MKIQLKPLKVIARCYTENELLDLSKLESSYVIRQLKALAESQRIGYIEVYNTLNSGGQPYSAKYDICFGADCFIKIK